MKKIISTNNYTSMTSLENLTKPQLIKMLMSMQEQITALQELNVQLQFNKKPIPAPRKSVKDMIQEYEDNIIRPPLEFRNTAKPIAKPRTKKPIKPVPLPRTKIEEVDKALKGYTKSFEISIKNNKDPLAQLQNTRKAIEYRIISILATMKGLKFVETLKISFTKMTDSNIIFKTAYFNSAPQTIINNLGRGVKVKMAAGHVLRAE